MYINYVIRYVCVYTFRCLFLSIYEMLSCWTFQRLISLINTVAKVGGLCKK